MGKCFLENVNANIFKKMENVFFRKNARSGIGGSEGSCHIDVLVFMPDVKLPDR